MAPPPEAKTAAAAATGGGDRDLLMRVERYLAKRDGVDKLLKISRYAAKIALATTAGDHPLRPRLKSFESSVGLSRKAFRLGKFVQDINAYRAAAPDRPLLAALAYGGEGLYYFVEQLVWLSKAGLIDPRHAPRLQKIGAWAELVGYVGSLLIKGREARRLEAEVRSSARGLGEDLEKVRELGEKLVMKKMSIVQDLADAVMAVGDIREGKGVLSGPLLMAFAGLLSALISSHKNWSSC